MITVKVEAKFTDIYTGQEHMAGEILELNDAKRVKNMAKLGVVSLVKITPPVEKSGKKVLVYQNLLFTIGGIETADYQLATAFPDRNIVFVFREANMEQALRLGQYCEVVMDDGQMTFDTDVLILANYDSMDYIKGRFTARKVYQQVHADWANMKKMWQWANFKWEPDKQVDRVLAVSETTMKALKTAFKEPIESVVVPNILNPPQDNGFRVFLTLSRFSAEKGADAIVAMARRFKEAGKSFLWLICGTMSDSGLQRKLSGEHSIVFIEPSIMNEGLIKNCDYLVQLSKNESYCYSVHQALACGKPCICSDIPEFQKVIEPGVNGWLVGQNLEGLDIDAIFGKLLNPKPRQEPLDPVWLKVLNGEL